MTGPVCIWRTIIYSITFKWFDNIFSLSIKQNHHHVDSLSSRSSRQGAAAENEVPLDIGSIAAAGERCIDKVVMVQETEYDDVITCKHSYTERCHTTYKTDYEPQQEEECEENYKKRCYIEFKNVASQERVEFCHTPLVRNCDLEGPTECTTEYKSQCTTRCLSFKGLDKKLWLHILSRPLFSVIFSIKSRQA